MAKGKHLSGNQQSTEKTNFRSWKAGKNWVYAAASLIVVTGGANTLINTTVEAAVSNTTVSQASSDAVLNSQANSLYSDTSSAGSVLSNSVNSVNSVANSLNSVQPSNTSDLSSFSSQANSLVSSANALSSANSAYSNALSSYSANPLAPSGTPSTTTNPTYNSYLSEVGSYQSAVSSYVSGASSAAASNASQTSMYDSLMADSTALSNANITLSNAKAKLDAALSALAAAVNEVATSTAPSTQTQYEADVQAAKATADSALITYKAAVASYLSAQNTFISSSNAYQISTPAFNGTATSLVDSTTSLNSAYNAASDNISNAMVSYASNDNSFAANSDYVKQHAAYLAAQSAYNAWKPELDKLNGLETNLQSTLSNFPTGSSYTTSNVATWQSQYSAAVSAIQTELSSAAIYQSAYQSALSNSNLPAGNPSYATFKADGSTAANAVSDADYFLSYADSLVTSFKAVQVSAAQLNQDISMAINILNPAAITSLSSLSNLTSAFNTAQQALVTAAGGATQIQAWLTSKYGANTAAQLADPIVAAYVTAAQNYIANAPAYVQSIEAYVSNSISPQEATLVKDISSFNLLISAYNSFIGQFPQFGGTSISQIDPTQSPLSGLSAQLAEWTGIDLTGTTQNPVLMYGVSSGTSSNLNILNGVKWSDPNSVLNYFVYNGYTLSGFGHVSSLPPIVIAPTISVSLPIDITKPPVDSKLPAPNWDIATAITVLSGTTATVTAPSYVKLATPPQAPTLVVNGVNPPSLLPIGPSKDVTKTEEGDSINTGEVALDSDFVYELNSSTLNAGRTTQLTSWTLTDQTDLAHDKYLGTFSVHVFKDGAETTLDNSNHVYFTDNYNASTGLLVYTATEAWTNYVNLYMNSSISWRIDADFYRYNSGEVYNSFTEDLNNSNQNSNTVNTHTPKPQPHKYDLSNGTYDLTGNSLLNNDSEMSNPVNDTANNPYNDNTSNNASVNINTDTVNRGDTLHYQLWLDTSSFDSTSRLQTLQMVDHYDGSKLDVDVSKIRVYSQTTGADVTSLFNISVDPATGTLTVTAIADKAFVKSDGSTVNIIDTTKLPLGAYYKIDFPAVVKQSVVDNAQILNVAGEIVVDQNGNQLDMPTETRVNTVTSLPPTTPVPPTPTSPTTPPTTSPNIPNVNQPETPAPNLPQTGDSLDPTLITAGAAAVGAAIAVAKRKRFVRRKNNGK